MPGDSTRVLTDAPVAASSRSLSTARAVLRVFALLLEHPEGVRADEVARSWRIVDPLLAYWHQMPDPIPLYHAGTWGPKEAMQLIENDGRRWHSL